ncbi:hypothetical protein B0T14DRAFT_126915 [Immersiella caudata]|uniref:Ubiquitin-like protease family profile domain-containing protein n=1 Tax=Immersiella caudata TaxID=314043 RepID=A0AA40C743_9PEZI|nr:hypothetical protein B0T14DRAFT_126915 [Immersiella caudata]
MSGKRCKYWSASYSLLLYRTLLIISQKKKKAETQLDAHPSPSLAKPVCDLTAESEDEPPSKRLKTDRIVSTLELSGGSTFAIDDHSLQRLQGSTWLNDQIVFGALRLIADVSDKGVLVAEPLSLSLRHDDRYQHDDRYNKVLLPMQIRQNHWVIGVYKQERVLVYDSLPTQCTEEEVSPLLHQFFSKTLQMDTHDYPDIWFTTPLRQRNDFDCGVMCIVAGFCEASDIAVPPEIDATVWRNILLRLLGPPDPPVDEYRDDLIELPKTKLQASESELPGISSGWLTTVSRSLSRQSRTIQMAVYSAELYLKIYPHLEGLI